MGFVETGSECDAMKVIDNNKKEVEIASHCLQFVFSGLPGLRFPFAHYPTKSITAAELNVLLWQCISMLRKYRFIAAYVMTDGASTNQSLFAMHLPKTISTCSTHCFLTQTKKLYS